jgi:hypothetical protein
MGYIQGEGRNQGTLFSVVLDDFMPADLMCRVIDAFVEMLVRSRVQSTWLKLVRLKFILTDPVFTSTIGGLSRRLVEPGISPSKMPVLDLVLISHRHLDHLSPASLELLGSRVQTVIVPPGAAKDFQDRHTRSWSYLWASKPPRPIYASAQFGYCTPGAEYMTRKHTLTPSLATFSSATVSRFISLATRRFRKASSRTSPSSSGISISPLCPSARFRHHRECLEVT